MGGTRWRPVLQPRQSGSRGEQSPDSLLGRRPYRQHPSASITFGDENAILVFKAEHRPGDLDPLHQEYDPFLCRQSFNR